MTERIAHLSDRGVISVSGPDASKLLAGIITNDVELLDRQPAIYSGLLSPQGKILFDFFVVKAGDHLMVDVARDKCADLVKRLTMYRLRAQVDIADVSDACELLALWGPNACSSGETKDTVSFRDPRHPDLGLRIWAEARFATDIASATNGLDAAPSDYHEHRIALGIPEGGKDWAFGDTFAHEALFDQLNGVSFTKGCYVGQEIVSRMQHRGTARKRIVRVVAPGALPQPGSEIAAGESVIGTLGSVAGHEGLAMIRLDRAAEAVPRGERLAAGPVPVTIEIPPWATFKLESASAAE